MSGIEDAHHVVMATHKNHSETHYLQNYSKHYFRDGIDSLLSGIVTAGAVVRCLGNWHEYSTTSPTVTQPDSNEYGDGIELTF